MLVGFWHKGIKLRHFKEEEEEWSKRQVREERLKPSKKTLWVETPKGKSLLGNRFLALKKKKTKI